MRRPSPSGQRCVVLEVIRRGRAWPVVRLASRSLVDSVSEIQWIGTLQGLSPTGPRSAAAQRPALAAPPAPFAAPFVDLLAAPNRHRNSRVPRHINARLVNVIDDYRQW